MGKDKTTNYDLRGVSADKEAVHTAVKNLDKGEFPNAFCRIFKMNVPVIPGNIMNTSGADKEITGSMYYSHHSDGAGTKPILAYLLYKETGSLKGFKTIAQDAIVMNLDDMLAAGISGPYSLNITVSRNKHLVPDSALAAIIAGAEDFCKKMRGAGVHIYYNGGETADVGDTTRTISVEASLWSAVPKEQVIEAHISAGDIIIGLSSTGRASWENAYNSGIGCNGLTNARHDILSPYYRQFTEVYDPTIPIELVYRGKYRLTDTVPSKYMRNTKWGNLTIADLLLAPTRTYAPLLVRTLNRTASQRIAAIIHNTGGGLKKCLKREWVSDNAFIKKDNLFPTPPIFKMLMDASGEPLRNVLSVYNMGHRLELYIPKKHDSFIQLLRHHCIKHDVNAQVIGTVAKTTGKHKLKISYGNQIEYFGF